MLSIQLFRQNKELILEGLKKKNFKEPELVDRIISVDERRRALQVENDALASSQNAAAKSNAFGLLAAVIKPVLN